MGSGSMCQGKCTDSLSVIVLINIYKHLLNSRDARTLKQISKFIGIIFSQSLYMEIIDRDVILLRGHSSVT